MNTFISIVVILVFVVCGCQSQLTVSNIYSGSCSDDNLVFLQGASSGSCSSASCGTLAYPNPSNSSDTITYAFNHTTSCSSSNPSPPSGFAIVRLYTSAKCSGTLQGIRAVKANGACVPLGNNQFASGSCSGLAKYNVCKDSACADCTSFTATSACASGTAFGTNTYISVSCNNNSPSSANSMFIPSAVLTTFMSLLLLLLF